MNQNKPFLHNRWFFKLCGDVATKSFIEDVMNELIFIFAAALGHMTSRVAT